MVLVNKTVHNLSKFFFKFHFPRKAINGLFVLSSPVGGCLNLDELIICHLVQYYKCIHFLLKWISLWTQNRTFVSMLVLGDASVIQCTCSAKLSDLDEHMVNILVFGIETYKRFRQYMVHINSHSKALYNIVNVLNIQESQACS